MPTLTKSLALTVLALAACGQSEAQKISLPPATAAAGSGATEAPIKVPALVARSTEVAAPVHASGTSEPIRKADLAPAMQGRIEKIHVREGQQVKAGQTLVTIDGRAAQLQAEQARASAAAAQAQADQLDADYKRLEPLAERGSIAASRLEQLHSQRAAAQAQARAAQSAAGAASRLATNATLTAPFAGTVIDVPHEVGELAGGGYLVRLADLTKIEVHVRVAARDLGRITTADGVTAKFPQLGIEVPGTIASIGYEVDPTTSTAEVVAVLPNADGKLRGGLFTEIEIQPTQKRAAMVVPKTAVAGTGAQATVFAIVGGKVTRQTVEVVPFDDTRVEIVKGLAPQTTLVAAQLDRVRDGAAVTAEIVP